MGILFFVIGLICIGVCVLLFTTRPDASDRVPVTATITDIDSHWHGDDREYDVYVRYEAEGQEYERELNYYSSGMRVGQKIEIYYIKGNPLRIGTKQGDALGVVIPGILGLVFAAVGGTTTAKSLKRSGKGNKLKETGTLVYAVYQGTEYKYTIRINHRSPYVIHAGWTDPASGTSYDFQSRYFYEDPAPQLEMQGVRSIPVYINPDKPKQYYMDLDGLL